MHLGDPPLSRAVPHEMHDYRERGRQLAVQSHPIETGRCAQRLQSGGDMLGGIGVDGAAPAFVPGVQRGQQFGDFSAPHLSDHQPVGPHAQCLPHQIAQSHPARSLLIGGTGFQADHMRMVRPQFGGVLGENDPLVHPDRAQQAGEERRLPEPLTETPLMAHTRSMSNDREHEPQPDDATAEEQSVILRAELAAEGWGADVPQPTPENVKRDAVQYTEADDEDEGE